MLAGSGVIDLVNGPDYTVNERQFTNGTKYYKVTNTSIPTRVTNGGEAMGHLHRPGRDPGTGMDDGDSVSRGIVQYIGWESGGTFGAGKVEFRPGAGYTYKGLGGAQPAPSDIRKVLAGLNQGGGRGSKAGG